MLIIQHWLHFEESSNKKKKKIEIYYTTLKTADSIFNLCPFALLHQCLEKLQQERESHLGSSLRATTMAQRDRNQETLESI